MAKSLGSSHLPTGLKRLTGGLECETYRLDLGGRHLVVKVLTKNGSDAATEFDNLLVVTDADVPTPVPVRLDDAGNWFGFPAIVMSALPGKPTLYPADVDGWIMGAAGGLAAVHDLDPGNARAVRAPRWQRWRPLIDRVGDEAGAVEERLGQLYERAEGDQKVFSHDDYNPGNVLFHDGDLSRRRGLGRYNDRARPGGRRPVPAPVGDPSGRRSPWSVPRRLFGSIRAGAGGSTSVGHPVRAQRSRPGRPLGAPSTDWE